MSIRVLCGLLLFALLFASCNFEDAPDATTAGPYIAPVAPVLQNPDTPATTVLKTDSLAKKVKRTFKPKSTAVKDALKSMKYSPEAVKLFVALADKTGGEAYFANNSKKVAETIIGILDKHTEEKTDIMILVDKTGSMTDDIENVQKSIGKIIGVLKTFKNVQLGWAAYGDKNSDGTEWFELHKLSPNLDGALTGIKELNVTGGGDLPESVNDAIWKTIDELNWRPDAKKMMLVVGDAHSLEPPLADKSLADVIKKCISSAVHVNLYPVVISTEDIYDFVDDTPVADKESVPVRPAITRETLTPEAMVTKVYPNPTADFATMEFSGTGPFLIEVKSLIGKNMFSGETTANRYSVDLSGMPAGTYLVTVTNKSTSKREVRQVVRN